MFLEEKYKPKKIEDIYGNRKKYIELKKILDINKKGNYIIYGDKGTGKTSFVEIFNNEKKHILKKYNIDNITPNIFLKSLLKKIILIDDVDNSITETKMKNLIKTIEEQNTSDYVFINSTHKFKCFQAKSFHFVNLSKINENALEKFILDIIKQENIKYNEKFIDNIIQKIIKNSNSNIREILQNLQVFINNKDKIKYTQQNKDLLDKNFKDTFYDNSFDIMSKVFNGKRPYDELETLYYTDTFIVPSFIYENFLKVIKDKKYLCKVYDSLIESDIMENNMSNNFFLMPYICYLKYIIPVKNCNSYKSRILFPSYVSKEKKIKNSREEYIKKRNKNICYHNYKAEDLGYINMIKIEPPTSEVKVEKIEDINIEPPKPKVKVEKPKDKIINYNKLKVSELRKIAQEKGIIITIPKKTGKGEKFLTKQEILLLLNH